MHRIVTGTISVVVHGVPYPGLAWNDALDALLPYWSDRCRHLQSGGKTADFVLFDEPEGILVTCDGGTCTLDFYRRVDGRKHVGLSGTCRLDVLVAGIARASKQVWSACVRHGWSSDHARALEDAWRGLPR